MTEAAVRSTRADSRRAALLDEAAWLFRQKGFHATSVRDIVSAVGMLPGSLYCHFANKEELLLAVYEIGIAEISRAVTAAVATESDPWRRFEAACGAHLEALLKSSDYPQVVVRVLPAEAPGARPRLVALRDSYEAVFRALIDDLPLPDGIDRDLLRRTVIGGLNATTTWFRQSGDSPRTIARKYLDTLRLSLGPLKS
ncbi:MAG: TetR/AcrR family transcriptional regulator [Alphaproteobacteria bacterium]|jgi:AcrR family transcriptional regulator|nr:TetR/AcrR family transcriptional regulator [Alphaproteobacteria bacterium]MDP6564402.1 TetR/AcrR family transcriptional regulator [Alphaproteobacteria bacterium]MDP6814119.1 TetR/AcrR family transcriptional regulator [Alphaproteobacteria bacterium]